MKKLLLILLLQAIAVLIEAGGILAYAEESDAVAQIGGGGIVSLGDEMGSRMSPVPLPDNPKP